MNNAIREKLDNAIIEAIDELNDSKLSDQYTEAAEVVEKLCKLRQEEEKIEEAKVKEENDRIDKKYDRIAKVVEASAKGGFSLAMLLVIVHVEKTGSILSKAFTRIPKIL